MTKTAMFGLNTLKTTSVSLCIPSASEQSCSQTWLIGSSEPLSSLSQPQLDFIDALNHCSAGYGDSTIHACNYLTTPSQWPQQQRIAGKYLTQTHHLTACLTLLQPQPAIYSNCSQIRKRRSDRCGPYGLGRTLRFYIFTVLHRKISVGIIKLIFCLHQTPTNKQLKSLHIFYIL